MVKRSMSTVTLHPAIVHFPIALLLLGSAIAVAYLVGRRRAEFALFALWLLFLGWVSTLAAVLSGLLAQSGLPPRAEYRTTLNWHIGTGMGLALVYGGLLYLWWVRRPREQKPKSKPLLDDPNSRLWVIIVLLVGALLVVATGWNGGRLVYEYGVNAG
jgi:uncharacterized membrane protein